MTLDNLPEQLQKNLEAAGLADLTVDQCEIIRRFLAGERTLVSGHDGAGKLTALVIGFAAKALASRRSLETGRLPEGLLITNHPEDAIVAAALLSGSRMVRGLRRRVSALGEMFRACEKLKLASILQPARWTIWKLNSNAAV